MRTSDQQNIKITSWNVNSIENKRAGEMGGKIKREGCMSIESWLEINNPAVIAFQETLNGEDITRDGYVEIHEVNTLYPNRSLAFFIRESIRILESGKVGTDTLFSQYARIYIPGVGSVLLVNVYLPNGTLREGSTLGKLVRGLLLEIRDLVERCRSGGDFIIVMGDFNTHNSRFGGDDGGMRCRRELENEFMDTAGLQAMSLPDYTWRRGDRTSYIDHIMVSHTQVVDSVVVGECLNGVGPRQYPDHRPVSLIISGKSGDFEPSDFKRYNWRRVTELQWSILNTELAEELVKKKESIMLMTASEIHAYIHSHFLRARARFLKPSWIKACGRPFFDLELREAKRVWKSRCRAIRRSSRAGYEDTMEHQTLVNRMLEARGRYRELFELKRASYYSRLAGKVRESSNPEELMRNLRRAAGDDTRGKIPIIVGLDGSSPADKRMSLNNLSAGFASVGESDRVSEYSDMYHRRRRRGIQLARDLIPQVRSSEWISRVEELSISSDEIQQLIGELKDTSPGEDEINVIFLKRTSTWSAFLLSRMLKLSFIGNPLPQMCLDANVSPLLKDCKKDRGIFGNYRPISITSIIMRLLERVIVRRLLKELDESSYLQDTQFGGRSGRGTEDALAFAYSQLVTEVRHSGECNGIFLDISKAFDRVDHFLLLEKLRNAGISEILIWWIFLFLSERRQRVRVGGDVSDWFSVRIGIPQGTCLGPILFLIFINDCPLGRRGSIFVDDMFIWANGTRSEQVRDLENRLQNITEWSNDWGVDFNISKTRHVVFGNSGSIEDPFVRMGSVLVTVVDRYLYLGVLFHQSLRFDLHVRHRILPRLRRESAYVRALLARADSNSRCTFSRILWKSKLQPIVEYGAAIWSLSTGCEVIDAIDNVQTTLLRKAMGVPSYASADGVLMELGITRCSIRLRARRVRLELRVRHSCCPNVLVSAWKRLRESRPRDTAFRSFVGTSPESASRMRRQWINTHPQSCAESVPGVDKLGKNVAYRYGFWRVYPDRGGRQFRARIRVFSDPYMLNAAGDLDCQRVEMLVGRLGHPGVVQVGTIYSRRLRIAIRGWCRDEFLRECRDTDACTKLSRIRGYVWYHDTLLHSIGDPGMRKLRKIRLGVSELRDHTHFMNSGDRTCPQCGFARETTSHYFLHCSKYSSPRDIMLRKMEALIGRPATICDILGFNVKLSNRRIERCTRDLRRTQYLLTLQYISQTKRFKY